MGVRNPGFQLLSIPEGSSGAPVDRLCLLPDQIGIYLERYLPLVALTLGVMIVDLVLMRPERRVGEGTILPLHKVKMLVDWWILRRIRRRRRTGRGLIGDFARYFIDVAVIPIGAFTLISAVFLVGL